MSPPTVSIQKNQHGLLYKNSFKMGISTLSDQKSLILQGILLMATVFFYFDVLKKVTLLKIEDYLSRLLLLTATVLLKMFF